MISEREHLFLNFTFEIFKSIIQYLNGNFKFN